MSYLGIDLGTSGMRVLLIDEARNAVGSAEREYPVSRPHEGWSEQDPAHWIVALRACAKELIETYDKFSTLRSIGVSGHMHGATLLDAAGLVLRPCILWNDTRAEREASDLDKRAETREISGNIVFPGFTAPKLLWVEKHEPEVFSQIHKVLLPAAYLNFFLTGRYVADMSDSAGTAWFDLKNRKWSETLLDFGHMRSDQMPELVEGCEKVGELRPDLASEWGLSHPVSVAGGAGDNAATACGIGVFRSGQALLSLGTSGVLLAASDACHPAPNTALHTFCHALPDRWYQMGVVLSATENLNWFARITGASVAELVSELGTTLQVPGPVRFLPYLYGERTPHNDAFIRAAFTGVSASTSRADLTRAILEGVSYGLRESLDAMHSCGTKVTQAIAVGGGSRSDYWLKLLATVLDIPIARSMRSEFSASLGAARLGMLASMSSTKDEAIAFPKLGDVFEPENTYSKAFSKGYSDFKSSYAAIRMAQ